jgi:hypothetical protein
LTTTKWEGAIVKECACAWLSIYLSPILEYFFFLKKNIQSYHFFFHEKNSRTKKEKKKTKKKKKFVARIPQTKTNLLFISAILCCPLPPSKSLSQAIHDASPVMSVSSYTVLRMFVIWRKERLVVFFFF